MSVIKNWAFQWKISFNPDPGKQAQKVIFSGRTKKVNHSPVIFNNNAVTQTAFQKHLGIILDWRLTSGDHLNSVPSKINKTIGHFRKMQSTLPRQALMAIL